MLSELPPDVRQTIEELLFSGRKIEAIKFHRAQTGVGLAESKAVVDEIEEKLKQAAPEKFKPASGGKGCGAQVLMALAAGTLLAIGCFYCLF
jgi:hypothetical protein